ncbi:MAG: 50S ribosomal protein L28 [Candidatus Melainabacteria bacterium]|nr:50S ribosomal protein L28 [Candidatus Melainabacteria bacterium]
MSRKCDVSGKKAQNGMRYSFLRAHFNPTAKRKFQVNLQTVRTTVNGKRVKLKVAASYLKSHPEIRAGIVLPLKKRSRKRSNRFLASLKV